MRRWRYSVALAAAAAVALVTGACTSNSGSPPAATSSSSTPPTTQSPPASGGTSNVTVTLANFTFTPGTVTVTSGGTIHLANSTPNTLHTFVITGHGTDVEIAAGASQDVKIDLPPGTYPFVCRIHQTLGMKGTLIVG